MKISILILYHSMSITMNIIISYLHFHFVDNRPQYVWSIGREPVRKRLANWLNVRGIFTFVPWIFWEEGQHPTVMSSYIILMIGMPSALKMWGLMCIPIMCCFSKHTGGPAIHNTLLYDYSIENLGSVMLGINMCIYKYVCI